MRRRHSRGTELHYTFFLFCQVAEPLWGAFMTSQSAPPALRPRSGESTPGAFAPDSMCPDDKNSTDRCLPRAGLLDALHRRVQSAPHHAPQTTWAQNAHRLDFCRHIQDGRLFDRPLFAFVCIPVSPTVSAGCWKPMPQTRPLSEPVGFVWDAMQRSTKSLPVAAARSSCTAGPCTVERMESNKADLGWLSWLCKLLLEITHMGHAAASVATLGRRRGASGKVRPCSPAAHKAPPRKSSSGMGQGAVSTLLCHWPRAVERLSSTRCPTWLPCYHPMRSRCSDDHRCIADSINEAATTRLAATPHAATALTWNRTALQLLSALGPVGRLIKPWTSPSVPW